MKDAKIIAFISSAVPDAARKFYTEVVGLTFVGEDPDSLVLRSNDHLVRVQKVSQVPPARGTALGWEVTDISAAMNRMGQRGVEFQRFDFLSQDQEGVATFPNGDKVAWFKDPDGNMLSLTQLSG